MKSIQRALIFKLGLWAFALSLLAGIGFYIYMRSALLRQFDESLAAKARAVATQVKREGDGRLEFEFSEKAMPEFQRAAHPEYFEIKLADGTEIARSKSLHNKTLPPAPKAFPSESYWDVKLLDGRSGRATRLWAHAIDEPVDAEDLKGLPGVHVRRGAPVVITLAASRAELDHTLKTLLSSLIIVAAVLSMGTIFSSIWTIRRVLRPLHQVSDDAMCIDAASLNHRFAADKMPLELRPICERLNDLLARLEGSFTRERRFTADVAHELRTPISELRSLAEVAIKWPEDDHASSEKFTEVLEIARQMQTIVNTLLALARCHDGRQVLALEPLSLRNLVNDAWSAQHERRQPHGIESSLSEIPDAIILTDKALFSSILGNLFSNAFDYTPAGGAISCLASLHSRGITLSIGNTNITLDADDLPHLFEPFWRKNVARNDSIHSGLGLALVAAYAKLLGIDVAATLDDDGWFYVRLTLPMQSIRRQTNSAEAQTVRDELVEPVIVASAAPTAP